MIIYGEETIAAVSTAPGEGGIGIVRVSGPRAAEILSRIFATSGEPPGLVSFDAWLNKIMKYGHIVDPTSLETLDEALVVFMQGPGSYTGEDVCELQCHGGAVPLSRILSLVCAQGAVPAQPGEFTKRAFLNGRLDLSQAGAVIDLIRSKTARGYHAAREQAEGRLSERVRAVRELLLSALAEIAVRIDYPEAFEHEGEGAADGGGASGRSGAGAYTSYGADEDDGIYEIGGTGAGGDKVGALLSDAAEKTAALLAGAEAGRVVRDGLRVVIVGKPNAGKSSLFNALAREDAAIVTETPGTTRDALEVWLDIRGVPVLLTDTAGIRADAESDIEALGIARAKEQYFKADAAIFLLDGSLPLSEEDSAIARMLEADKKLLLVSNKADLPQAFSREDAAALLPFSFDAADVLQISLVDDEASGAYSAEEGGASGGAKNSAAGNERASNGAENLIAKQGAAGGDIKNGAMSGRGVGNGDPGSVKNGAAGAGADKSVTLLENRLEAIAFGGAAGGGANLLVTRERHKLLLEQAASEIAEARAALSDGAAPEFAEVNISAAYAALGEITGETATDDVIDRVFAEFCVGK